MSEFRMDKNTTEHYYSFEEMAAAWGCKQVTRQTKDKQKLESQRRKFCERHLCRACKQPLQFINGTNGMSCVNPECKGIRFKKIDKEGNEIITYKPSYDLLDDLGTTIAMNIFAN